MSNRSRSIVAFSLGILLVLQTNAGIFLFPRQAAAIPVGVVASVPDAIKFAFDKIWQGLEKVWTTTGTQILNRALIMFTSNIAQKAATGLAEGGTGGKPAFKTLDFKNAVRDAADAAVGDAVDQLGRGVFGQSICSPPELRLGLSLSTLQAIEPPAPTCTFKNMQQQWGKFLEKGGLFNQPDFTKQFAVTLDPKNTEIGAMMQDIITIEHERAAAAEASASEQPQSEFDRIVNPVSGTTKTPAKLVEGGAINATIDIPYEGLTKVFEPTGKWYADWAKVGAGVFVTTFVQKYMQRMMAGLFNPEKKQRNITLPGGGISRLSTQGATSSVTSFSVGTAGGEFDALSEFTTCPEDPSMRSMYNCVIDQNFADAIRQGLTIAEAVADDKEKKRKPLLQAKWPFGFWGANADIEPEYNQGYGYSNMKKLRRMRMIPVGWELAAELVKGPPSLAATTLENVLAGFNARGVDGICGTNDQGEGPFCGLVDPQWVLKAPILQCNLRAAGSQLQAGTDNRMEYCADVQDCVVTNEDGTGCRAWGYCTRERNAWRFPGRACPAQFNTCQQFSREGDGTTYSFLRNTVNACARTAAGCRRYSTAKSTDKFVWTNAKGDQNDNEGPNTDGLRFFNKNAQACTGETNGCRAFLNVKAVENGAVVDKTADAYAAVQAKTKTYKDYFPDKPNEPPLPIPYTYLKGTRTFCYGNTEEGTKTGGTPTGDGEGANAGCELYTPTTIDPPVPAVVASGDRCDESCVGYDTYKEVASAFAIAERFPALIPKKARTCSVEAAGCAEFTNLDAAQKRGEAREYYTALRQCQKPITDSKTYFTWVGTETTGYQLQTHSLKASDQNSGRAPCTKRLLAGNNCVDPADAGNPGVCIKDDITAGDADCREFYSEDGYVSYRRLSKTIISDEGCIRYRKTIAEGDNATAQKDNCEGSGGAWENNVCTYVSLPRESRSCSAQGVGCREYKGNTANDIRIILNETFDDPQKPVPDTWVAVSGAIATSGVSIQSTGKSLKVSGSGANVAVTLKKNDVSRLRVYLLSFWAQGAGAVLSPYFESAPANMSFVTDGSVTLDNLWKEYTLGPLFVTETPSEIVKLHFNLSGASQFLLDNVRVKEVRDDFYLIKDSWTIPDICTAPPSALGCREYTDRRGTPQYIKKFSHLCKEKFVGCTIMIDTKNSLAGSNAADEQKFKNGQDEGTSNDDVTVPKDELVYVVDNPKDYCAEDQKGCGAFGMSSDINLTTSFSVKTCRSAGKQNGKPCNTPENTTLCTDPKEKGVCQDMTTRYVNDDPDKYSEILCVEPDIGCDAYNTSAGDQVYFKDPGKKTCDWRRITGTTAQNYGWFRSDSENATEPDCTTQDPALPPKIDGTDTPLVDSNNPKSARYTRKCTAEYDRCTAFIDVRDTTSPVYPKGRPYFAINDETLDSSRKDCNSAVSAKQGCILFQNTGDLDNERKVILRYDSQETYKANAEKEKQNVDDDSVGPKSCTTASPSTCDTNIVLKVERDRACGEWLTCMSGAQVLDGRTQTRKNVCYQIGTCLEPSIYNVTECGYMKPDDPASNIILDRDLYKKRSTAWSGKEYAGYSIPYRYPVVNLQQLSYGKDSAGAPTDFRLSNLEVMVGAPPCKKSDDCTAPVPPTPDVKCDFGGSITNGVCKRDKGIGKTPIGESIGAVEKDCRAYPRTDAPFPSSVVVDWQEGDLGGDEAKRPKEKKKGFEQANVAQRWPSGVKQCLSGDADKLGTACATHSFCGGDGRCDYRGSKGEKSAQCSYVRNAYQDGTTLFFDLDQTSPTKIIYSLTDKVPNLVEDSYNLRTISREHGLQGYCLEQDTRTFINGDENQHPCFSWFPVDLIQGDVDVDSSFPEAAWTVDPARRFYCIESERQEYRTAFSGDTCTLGAFPDPRADYDCPTYGKTGGSKKYCDYDREQHYSCSPKGGQNWYPYNGILSFNVDRISYTEGGPRTICKKLAVVSDTATQANLGWTDRLKNLTAAKGTCLQDPANAAKKICVGGPMAGKDCTAPSNATLCDAYQVPDLNYKKAALADPYGAINSIVDLKSDLTIPGPFYAEVESGNTQPVTVPSLYGKQGEQWPVGASRLRTVFARGFGVWEWKEEGGGCVKYCSGGMYDNSAPKQCTGDPGCPSAATGECKQDPTDATRKICVGNPLTNDEFCTVDSNCKGAGTCVPVGGSVCTAVGKSGYNPIASTIAPNLAWDFARPSDNPDAQGPRVYAAAYDDKKFAYTQGAANRMTVETNSDGVLPPFRGQSRSISVKFYAFNANGNQMPLRRVMVDWGDGSRSVSQGSFKNHKHECQRYCANTVDASLEPTLITRSVDSVPYNHVDAGAQMPCTSANVATACPLRATGETRSKCVKSVGGLDVGPGETGVCHRSPLKGCTSDSGCPLSGYCNIKINECRARPKTCTKDNDCGASRCAVKNFGDSTDACVQDAIGGVPGYFIRTHTYQCDSTKLGQLPQCDGVAYPCKDTVKDAVTNTDRVACVFKPRTQVLDNWGWCNGTCRGGRGCYDQPRVSPSVGESLECSAPENALYKDAWAEYAGRVILMPI